MVRHTTEQNRGANSTHEFVITIQKQIEQLSVKLDALNTTVLQNANTSSENVGYIGSWDADTNTPTLGNNGVGGTKGDYYDVSVAGTTSIDGEAVWLIGDFITHNGVIWQKINNSGGGGGGGSVTSVNGKIGVVVIDQTDVGLGDVTNESPAEILADSTMTGTTTLENVIEETLVLTGAGNTYDLSVSGKHNAVVNNTTPSIVLLPLTPTDGFTQRIINYGTSTIDITPIAPNQIESLGVGVPLTLSNNLDKVTLLFVSGIWNLI